MLRELQATEGLTIVEGEVVDLLETRGCVSGAVLADGIRIGAFHDLSGATAAAGRDYAMGIAEAVRYVNDEGGINGKQIELFQYDYGYRTSEVHAKYKHLKRLGVVAVLGWHIVDTQALSDLAAKDKMPYLTAFYSADLSNPENSPYTLYAATDDSSNARAALTAWFDERWPLKADYGSRRPRVQFAYMAASPNLSAPVKAVKDQAELFGFRIGPDLDISIFATEVRHQIKKMNGFKPDLVYHGNTVLSVAVTLRQAADAGIAADHIVNNWAFNEKLVSLAGPAAEGVMGASGCAFYGADALLMEAVWMYGMKYHPGVAAAKRSVHTVQAWANVLALREALKRADAAGKISGETIMKSGFETFNGVEIGLEVAPLTFTAADHRASGEVNIYRIENQQFAFMTRIDLKGRWPDKWAKDWFGW
jgi:branched-chain amino acid transport system substrate-binding protein